MLEQQFREDQGKARLGVLLVPSANVRMALDPAAPAGKRVDMRVDGRPLDRAARYRVSINNFLASGGDGFTALEAGSDTFDAGLDLDATEAYLGSSPALPGAPRILVRGAAAR